jgi:hypothetical protein
MVFTILKYTAFRGGLTGYLFDSLVKRGETLTCSLVVFFIELEGRAEKKELLLAKLKKKKDNWITRRSLSLVSHIRTYSRSVCVCVCVCIHFVFTVPFKSLFLQCLCSLY